MLISLNTVKTYAGVPKNISDQELIDLIGSRLVEVEEVIDLAPKYQNIYIVKVVTCEPIPETHLNLCQIDAGGQRTDLAKDGLIQVVCGAPNVHAGMLAVWIAPGAVVPSTYGNENFQLGVRKLRGYESNGMLAGADELDLDNEHKAIAEIDPKMAQPGDSFATVFSLNDVIIDVENKSLTHRPDCFGLIGFAREVAGILGQEFAEPELFQDLPGKVNVAGDSNVKVKITDAELCPRYSCAVFDLPKHQPSKYLTLDAVFLAKAGMRAIDPMVDLTNLLMLKTGQPLHAFDYDKLVQVGGTKTPQIIVRTAEENEELQLLDGKTIQCNPNDILITSNNVPIALAGAMGGKNTEIDANTQRVVLESATFSLYHLRKTQMAHGIFSEAITRFTKGQPASITLPVLQAAVQDLGVPVLAEVDAYPQPVAPVELDLTLEQINGLLGTDYSADLIARTLHNVGFGAATKHDVLKVTAPLWRTDIHIAEDVIEEVGRLLGYDNIALTLPLRPFAEAEIAPMFQLKSELREILSHRLGMHELLTYSFVSKQLMTKVGKDPADCYEIANSISPELQCFRSEIVPSLLDKVRENLKSGHTAFTLYEMNQVSRRSAGLTDENTPIMRNHLGIVDLHDFYTLKAKLLALFRDLKITVEYAALSKETAEHHPYLEPKRSAEMLINGKVFAAFGEVKAAVLRNFKLEQTVTACELALDTVVEAPRQEKVSFTISKFPAVERDLTLQVAADAAFGRVLAALEQCLSKQELIWSVEPVSIYQATAEATTKNLSFHLKFTNPNKTLDSTEISAIMESISAGVAQVGATTV